MAKGGIRLGSLITLEKGDTHRIFSKGDKLYLLAIELNEAAPEFHYLASDSTTAISGGLYMHEAKQKVSREYFMFEDEDNINDDLGNLYYKIIPLAHDSFFFKIGEAFIELIGRRFRRFKPQ